MRTANGFTLWELVITLALTAVLAALGVPSLRWLLLDLKLSADVNSFVAGVQLARSEAAKRRAIVVMCNSSDGSTCGTANTNLDAGWIVFANTDEDRPPVRDPEEPVLQATEPSGSGSIRANRRYFEFRPFLRRSTNGTVVFCDARGATTARAVIVSYTGRPRTVAARDGARLSCPPPP